MAMVFMYFGNTDAKAQLINYEIVTTPSTELRFYGEENTVILAELSPVPALGLLNQWDAWVEGPDARRFSVRVLERTATGILFTIARNDPTGIGRGNKLVIRADLLGLLLPVEKSIPIFL